MGDCEFERAQDLEIGLNATFKKLIQGDVVLCLVCGATQMGP